VAKASTARVEGQIVACHLQKALRASRRIGAAIGIVVTTQEVSQVEALAPLNRASSSVVERQ
jgi:hypothetical protein